MPNLTDLDLRDPAPPVPGTSERAAVAARAHQLGRRRRMMQGAGALGMVAAVAVGVAALTAGGTSGPGATNRIEAASAADTTDAVAPTTVAPTPVTTAPAAVETPAPDSTPAEVAAPDSFAVSGTVANVPEGVTLTLTITGPGGTFTAIVDGAGSFSVSGVPAGDYTASYEWNAIDGTASQVGNFGTVTISGDSTVSLTLP
jgi:hypothetical protein